MNTVKTMRIRNQGSTQYFISSLLLDVGVPVVLASNLLYDLFSSDQRNEESNREVIQATRTKRGLITEQLLWKMKN
jgi:hypothetical protein